jgi:acyl-CoA reductase-like NAD-dependent aldehyde dehydrogenase
MDADLRSIASARRSVEAAWDAYRSFLGTDVKLIDDIVWAMSRAVQTEAKRLGALAAEETGYGNAEDKRIKNLFNAVSVADWLHNVKTLGVLWQDEVTKIAAIGEPMGVVAALIPVTNPTSTIIYKVLSAVKAGNAVVCAPHPRGVRCGIETVRVMAEAAEQLGAPPGLIQCLDEVTLEGTAELMRHRRTSVVMATGGPGMVRAAYSSGKPTLAVGAGNVPCYVHASKGRDLDEVAEQIIMSKCFDYGTACVSEQAVMVDREIARELRHEIKLHGGYFCSPAESESLGELIFSGKRSINPDHVGQSAQRLASVAGFDIPPNTRVLVTEQTEIGWQAPLSAEKLNPILAWYEVKDAAEGVARSHEIARFGGWGHTAVIHCDDSGVIADFSGIPVGRVLVNTPAIIGGMGFSTDLEPSFMLGTGTWSGSITSDNVTALHLINIKRVAYESRPWRDIYDVYGD